MDMFLIVTLAPNILLYNSYRHITSGSEFNFFFLDSEEVRCMELRLDM